MNNNNARAVELEEAGISIFEHGSAETLNAANMEEDRPDPQASAYPPRKVLAVVASDFVEREPDVAEMMSKLLQ